MGGKKEKVRKGNFFVVSCLSLGVGQGEGGVEERYEIHQKRERWREKKVSKVREAHRENSINNGILSFKRHDQRAHREL